MFVELQSLRTAVSNQARQGQADDRLLMYRQQAAMLQNKYDDANARFNQASQDNTRVIDLLRERRDEAERYKVHLSMFM